MAGRTRKFNPVLSEQDKATLEWIFLIISAGFSQISVSVL